MRSVVLVLIDIAWLLAALGLLVWGSILFFKDRARWRQALGLLASGVLLIWARFISAVWQALHNLLDG